MTVTLSDRAGPPLVIRLFGSFEVCRAGQPLPTLRTRKGQWLVALLALRAGQEVERAWLAGTLWPDSSEAQALANLRNSLTDLRGALGPEEARLRSPTPHTLCLDLAGAEVDVVAFDAAIAQEEAPALEQAVLLYRGPLLEGCTEEWAFQERQAREQAYLAALETLAEHAMAAGNPAAAERHLRRVVAADPLRENAQRALMEALAASGNHAAATLAYRELRRRLHHEINAEPDAETQALYQLLRAEARDKADRVDAPRGDGASSRVVTAGPVSLSPHPPVSPSPLPEGTITFLFTDIEGSTRLWEEHPAAMPQALSRHNDLLHRAIGAYDGHLFKMMGDQCCAAFASAQDALAAALTGQRALAAEAWGPIGPMRVRMALHTGAVAARGGDYLGPPLNRVARLLAAAHGGQILLSLAAAELVREQLPDGTLLRDLGVHRLRDLTRPEQIFQLVAPGLPADFPPLQSLEAFPHNLPLQLTSFIGREDQIAEVERLLSDHRLVTLTGAGGCGKTRLALQAAAELLGTFSDGVWFVDLAPLVDPELVPQAVTTALGLQEAPGRPPAQLLADYLKPRQLLLVLDNCEHLIEACAQLAQALLQSCPQVRVLATSREALGIAGEGSYRVPPLSLPDPQRQPTLEQLTQYEAVRLFVDRAEAVQPAFQVTSENASAVAEVCCRLDGIPLAIELAAAWTKLLSVEQLAQRLDDRFRLLTGGSRTALPRQQTLRALIDWSYDLLSAPERALLRRLSVFAGGWTLAAAEAVCVGAAVEAGDVVYLLARLVDQSLVVVELAGVRANGWRDPVARLPALPSRPAPAEPRFRLLETVRQYGQERLREAGEAEWVRVAHRGFFLRLAEDAEPELRGSAQGTWLDRLDGEHDNLRAALDWCQAEEDGGAAGVRLVGALWWFWVQRGYSSEGRQRLERVLSRGSGVPPAWRAKALQGAWNLAYWQGDHALAQTRGEEGLALAREAGDPWLIAYSLFQLGMAAANHGDRERAAALATESLALAREVGDPWLISQPLLILGVVARDQGDYERATGLLAESLALARQSGDRFTIAMRLMNLGLSAQDQGSYEQAGELCREGLALCHELKNQRGIAWCLEALAGVAGTQGRAEQVAQLLGAVGGLLESISLGASMMPRTYHERNVAAARAALGEEAFAAAWAAGRAMPLEQIITTALTG